MKIIILLCLIHSLWQSFSLLVHVRVDDLSEVTVEAEGVSTQCGILLY